VKKLAFPIEFARRADQTKRGARAIALPQHPGSVSRMR
jgi:hypothetical protein